MAIVVAMMHPRGSHGTRLLLLVSALLFAASCSGGPDSGPTWKGDAPFGTLPDGTPDNEKVSPASFGPSESIAWNTSIVKCLNAAGFDAALEGDGRFGMQVTKVPREQAKAYDAATAACEEEFPHTAPTELTPTEWRHLYEANLRHADCLRQHGLDVPEASSQSAWLDSQGGSWNVSAAFDDVAEAERIMFLTICPAPG